MSTDGEGPSSDGEGSASSPDESEGDKKEQVKKAKKLMKKAGKELSDDQIRKLRKMAKAKCAKREREEDDGNRLAQKPDRDGEVLERVKEEVRDRLDDLSPEEKRELADAICRKV